MASWILGTTEQVVRFYVFDTLDPKDFRLIDQLDTTQVPMAADKETAKFWAMSLGLKTWRYIRM